MDDRVEWCRACPLGTLCSIRTRGAGPVESETAIVGINPSESASDITGAFSIPYLAECQRLGGEPPKFIMRGSARAMWHLARVSGIDLASVYSTNAVKCSSPGNRAPTPTEVETCRRTHLTDELARMPNLRRVLVFGRSAGRAFGLSDFGMRKIVEETIADAILLRHPNSTLRKWTNLGRDATRLREALRLGA